MQLANRCSLILPPHRQRLSPWRGSARVAPPSTLRELDPLDVNSPDSCFVHTKSSCWAEVNVRHRVHAVSRRRGSPFQHRVDAVSYHVENNASPQFLELSEHFAQQAAGPIMPRTEEHRQNRSQCDCRFARSRIAWFAVESRHVAGGTTSDLGVWVTACHQSVGCGGAGW